MAASQAYLIRRDCRQFLGPMNSEEFKKGLKRLDFGLQDEISGHCGPWVILDSKEELNAKYPEIASLLGEALPLSWRETTSHARIISRHRTKGDKNHKSAAHKDAGDGFREYLQKQRNKSRAITIFFVLLIIAAGVIAAGIVLRKKDDLPPIAEVVSLSEKSDLTEFFNLMGVRVIPFASRIVKSQKNLNSWLPLFRMYAYNSTGNIDGISQKLLRGDAPAVFNHDCTVEGWKRRWKENTIQTQQFLSGKSLQKNPWTKILALDPYWVKRRPQKGWVNPNSIYEGCLMTASLAIQSLAAEASSGDSGQGTENQDNYLIVSSRLLHQLNIIHGLSSISPSEASAGEVGALGMLTCLESQTTASALGNCKTVIHHDLDTFIGEHFVLAMTQLALTQGRGRPDAQWQSLVKQASTTMSAEEIMSRLDLSPELKFVGLVQGGLDIEQAKGKIKMEFPEVKFE